MLLPTTMVTLNIFREICSSWKNDKNNDLAEKNTFQDESAVVGVEYGRGRLLEERGPVGQGRRRPGRRRRQGEHQQSEEEHAWK